jgi:cytochrome c biogenesis protein CcmG/thiol:disulfide interchange protein DsbE
VNRLLTRYWWLISGVVLIAAGAWILVATNLMGRTDNTKIAAPREGFQAPNFTLLDLDQNQVKLSSFNNQVILINFWASWCPPCQAEMPAIEAVYQAYRDQGLVVLGIDTVYQDNQADAIQFIHQKGLTFPILLDQGSAARAYQLQALPTTFIIDRRGIIHKVTYGGPITETFLRTEIEGLLDRTK